MIMGGETFEPGKQIGDDLEPYRRLVETQRQLIEMARKHEQTKREYAALCELLAREVVKRPSWRNIVRHRIEKSLSGALKRLSRPTAAEASFGRLNNNQPLSC